METVARPKLGTRAVGVVGKINHVVIRCMRMGIARAEGRQCA
jgi:hypothetical protein